MFSLAHCWSLPCHNSTKKSMKHLYPKSAISTWLIMTLANGIFQPAKAQCPAGSSAAVDNGHYNNGSVVCVSGNFNGNLKLNNGAKLVIVSGGNFTGNIETNQGALIEIKAGGSFKPATANNLAAAITNNRNGAVVLNNVSLSNGFDLINDGTVTWSGNWNQNHAVTVNNGPCGTMTFSQQTSLQNGATINNNGNLIFQSGLNTHSGTAINNRGRLTVGGDFNAGGYFLNQWQAVFRGDNNNFNTGDSVINLYTLVFKKAAQGTIKMRNEGLFWIGGSFQYNGGDLLMNRSNAQLRIGGALSNNGTIKGAGSVYVAGSFGNNGTLTGKNAAEKLSLNQSIAAGTTTNTQYNYSLLAQDTAGYIGGIGNPDVCAMSLPMVIASFKGTYNEKAVQLSWATLSESNGEKFVVEYSTDGRSFAKAGEVPAKGNSTVRVNYQYRFDNNIASTLYFRLRMVDLDGSSEYSTIIMVKTGTAQKFTADVFPNPFAEKLEITVSLTGTMAVGVKLIDMNGRVVKGQGFAGQAGNNKYTITGLGQLNKGIYIAEITAGEEKWIQKLIR